MFNSKNKMPKSNSDYPVFVGLRVSAQIKDDLLYINPKQLSEPAREAIEQYIPIKKLMLNPMALPRTIGTDKHKIEFSVDANGKFQLKIGDQETPIEADDLRILQANIFQFTSNLVEA